MASRWVDTHGHLFLLDEPAGAVLDRAADRGVAWVLCPGVDAATAREARAIAEAFPTRVSWSVGLHPHDADRWADEEDEIIELAASASAIGECGLDYYRDLAPRDAQLAAFRAQVELATELGKPVIIHCRDAFADVHSVVEEAGLGEAAILHCWTGGPRWTKRFRDLDVTFSFAGALTYPTGDTLRLGAAEAPPDQTMLETDSPYLTPEPKRREANEPANIPITGAVLADVWGMSIPDVAHATTATAERVLGAPGG